MSTAAEMKLQAHQFAEIFPLIEGGAYLEFVEDVRLNGIREPITLYEGKILDGRNRHRAATELDVECPTETYDGNDALGFVISLNVKRRHLDESQRSMVAAAVETLKPGRPGKDANLHDISRDQAAAMLNVSTRSVASAKAVREKGVPELVAAVESGKVSVSAAADAAKLPKQQQRDAVAKGPSAVKAAGKRASRDQREVVLAEKIQALPGKRYGLIFADPEWRFEPRSRETGMDRAADNHYPTSETEEIARRDIDSIAAQDCVLGLWATAPMIEDGLYVMRKWGFIYKTQVIWFKQRPGQGRGTGYWFLGEHEILLVGTRGLVVAPAPGSQFRSVVLAPVGEHSAKPDVFLEMFETYFPNIPKIELNRRGPARPGWDAWGNEAGG